MKANKHVTVFLPPTHSQKTSTTIKPRPFARTLVQTSIASPANTQPGDEEAQWEDWVKLQKLADNAQDVCEDLLPTLRAVIHESVRFLRLYIESSGFETPPATIHAILGHALFLFGSIVSSNENRSLLFDNEPSSPVSYWLAALDVFAMADNIPTFRENSGQSDTRQFHEWKMHMIWGHTLVSFVRTQIEGDTTAQASSSVGPNPKSPLGFIELNRPPCSALAKETQLIDLLNQANDHVTRGIFHMPRSGPAVPNHIPAEPSNGDSSQSPTSASASAFPSSTLVSIAEDIIHIAPQLPLPHDRAHWLRWADSLLSSASNISFSSSPLSTPTTTTALSSSLALSRGRCNLILARALLDHHEDDEWKEEAQEALKDAIEFLERVVPPSPHLPSSPGTKRKWSDIDVDALPTTTVDDDEARELLRDARALMAQVS